MTNELMHHGILGMHWGVRRYQNKDGSLTAAGRKRVNKLTGEYEKLTGTKMKKAEESSPGKSKGKSISEMSNQEIQEKITRIRLEKDLNSLSPKTVSNGKRFARKIMNDVITPAATDIGRQLAKSVMADGVNRAFNLEGESKVYANNKKK